VCPPGAFCVAGSFAPTNCSAGSYAAGESNELCSSCEPGSYQSSKSATSCLPCPNGFSCPSESTVVPIPANCRPGTFVAGAFTSADNCTHCSPGFKCLGATSPALECPPGSYQPESRQSGCAACGGGTYQNETAALDCKQCIPGHFCAPGGSAPLSCKAGSFSSATNLTNAEDCTRCPLGHSCATGSLQPSRCLPGSIAGERGLSTCELCRAGKFTRDRGSTACQSCIAGYFCAEGAAAPLPCPGGTHKNSSLIRPMESEADCVTCGVGTFCPVGSDAEMLCAPGTVNPHERRETCMRCTAGTFQNLEGNTTCNVCTPGHYCAEGASTPLPCPAGFFSNRTDLHRVEQCLPTPPGFFAGIGRSTPERCPIGSFAGQMGSPACEPCAEGTFADGVGSTACTLCAPGSWCSADRQIPCAESTYNSEPGASLITNCSRCPERTTTNDLTGVTSAANCSCSVTFYLAPAWMPVDSMRECRKRCCTCPIGSDCDNKADLPITLASLRVNPGYFRLGDDKIDVRRCPDAAANCPRGRLVCDNSTSGCQGGRDIKTICRPGLNGTFCRSCIEPFHYYVSAAKDVFAHCETCDNAVRNGLTSGLGIAAVMLGSVALLAGVIIWRLRRNPTNRATLAWAFDVAVNKYTLPNKIKIIVGFYMIATKIEDVYQVFLPPEVREILQQIQIVISLGLGGIPLACVGADGYVNRLLFWMVSPLLLLSLVIIVVVVKTCLHVGSIVATDVAKQALPVVLRIAFLVYPCAQPTTQGPRGVVNADETLRLPSSQTRDERRV
jgi:hypothetical protein